MTVVPVSPPSDRHHTTNEAREVADLARYYAEVDRLAALRHDAHAARTLREALTAAETGSNQHGATWNTAKLVAAVRAFYDAVPPTPVPGVPAGADTEHGQR